MALILRAEPVVKNLVPRLEERVHALQDKGVTPHLKVILVGENPASVIYTKNKKKFIEMIGGFCEIVQLEKDIPPESFLHQIKRIIEDPQVHGCLIQLPLPQQLQHLDTNSLIPPAKDVDGFNYYNLGTMLKAPPNQPLLWPCTPVGILELLKHYQIPIAGQHAVIIGRSLIVGKPLSMLLTQSDATVTLCHSKTRHIKSFTQQADIIFCALGVPKFLTADFISSSKSQVIIDIGINRLPDGKICGDADFDNIVDLVSHITPVPGGVGPLTIMALTQNLLEAAENSVKIK